jgi:putative nucleotidyltransferase with HDIG domain
VRGREEACARAAELCSQVGATTGAAIACGVATYPEDADDRTNLQHAADRTLVLALDTRCSSGGVRAFDPLATPPRPDGVTRTRGSRDPQLATVVALAEALDLRDADTSLHSQMVGWYAELIAQQLELPPADVERIRTAGLLHDVGKIGVPDAVLRKPGKLDDDEWKLMQSHAEIGARVLTPLDAPDVREWVLCHHERPDGRGYPAGRELADIPLAARILAVADSYEAMTADRVYRAAPGPHFARAELARCAGSQFDPAVVDAFLAVLDRVAPLVDADSAADEEAAAA